MCSFSYPFPLWFIMGCWMLFPSPLAFSFFQHQCLFQWVSSSHQVAKVLELQLQQQSFQWIFRIKFLYYWFVWYPCSPRDSQESSPASWFESINSSVLTLLYGSTRTFIYDTRKFIALTIMTFVGKVKSLLFNMLPKFAPPKKIGSFPSKEHASWIWWLQSLSTVMLEPKK